MEGNHWELMKSLCFNICDVQKCHVWHYRAVTITGIGDLVVKAGSKGKERFRRPLRLCQNLFPGSASIWALLSFLVIHVLYSIWCWSPSRGRIGVSFRLVRWFENSWPVLAVSVATSPAQVRASRSLHPPQSHFHLQHQQWLLWHRHTLFFIYNHYFSCKWPSPLIKPLNSYTVWLR